MIDLPEILPAVLGTLLRTAALLVAVGIVGVSAAALVLRLRRGRGR